jgi:hypothetical protein
MVDDNVILSIPNSQHWLSSLPLGTINWFYLHLSSSTWFGLKVGIKGHLGVFSGMNQTR